MNGFLQSNFPFRGPIILRLGNEHAAQARDLRLHLLAPRAHSLNTRTGSLWGQAPGDHRVSTVGKLLRATHLDELPQLVNVLMGDMSLIGPRPERPEIVHQLQARVDKYLHRLKVRPGITGLAQVQLPPDIDVKGV